MSQHDFTVDNQTFPNHRADVNLAVKALASTNSGATAPSTPFTNQMWVDTSATPWLLKMYDGADWITMGEINASNNTFNPATIAGSWTPVIAGGSVAGSQTYDYQVGRYERVGNMVTVWFSIKLTAFDGATSGNIEISPLPFTAANITNVVFAGTVGPYHNINLDVGGGRYQLSVDVVTNTGVIRLLESGDNVAAQAITDADMANTSQIHGTVTYKAA